MSGERIELLFLGSGTSTGVPMIGCHCATCTSTDPRDNRTRSSVLFRWREGDALRHVLVDTSTDLRFQALRERLDRIDSVLFTHAHADHVHGLDELRSFNFIQKTPIPCYGPRATLDKIRTRFDYIFDPNGYEGGGRPKLELNPVEGEFVLYGRRITALPVRHGPSEVFGYRIGPIVYITDCNFIPDETYEKTKGAEIVIIGATQRKPHPTHLSIYQAAEAIKRTGAARGYITHMNHDIKHEGHGVNLPAGTELAYDGLLLSAEL